MKIIHVQMTLICLCVSMSAVAQTVTGSGTPNAVPVFTGTSPSSTLGSSVITQSNGYVGIGTTSPASQLHVYGSGNQILTLQSTTAAFPGISFANTVGGYTNQLDGVTGSLYWFNGSTRNMTLLQNGNLGIGLTTPLTTLDVGGMFHVSGLVSPTTTSQGAYIGWNALTGGTGETDFINNPGGGSGGFVFMSVPASGSPRTTVMKISSTGALTFADGTAQTTAWTGVLCGGDYAEAVQVDGDLKHYGPGDVLVIASDKDGDVEKASEPYSTKVVGIYATKPGVIGRRQALGDSPDAAPMAMVGIVPAKVSAENGPIHKGDLLVSASAPGYAMKGTDRNRMLGAVIGKALGSLDSGRGVIEAVVTLQ